MPASATRLSLVVALAIAGQLSSASGGDAGIDFFETSVRPILVAHCYECHSVRSKEPGGGLLLDSRQGWQTGGESGAVIAPGKPDDSRLVMAVRYTNDALQMPPKGKLPAAAVAGLEAWVRRGAPDPRVEAAAQETTGSWDEILRSRRKWWSLQPVHKSSVPPVKDTAWSDQPVDQFILSALEAKGLGPAQAAEPRTLLRRLYLVLTGLPPTPEQADSFVQACDAAHAPPRHGAPRAALEAVVDDLLASPHFGERWARHWMDVVRFTETHGNEWNYEVHHAWRYRDYLIRAFNADVPYDQFVREHIAGDLLAQPRWNESEHFNESVIGTAFYRFGEVNHDDCIGLRQIGFDLADNQIDTLTKAFQATTVACARCHDHKLDAVSMNDYYGLLGIVRSTRLVSQTIDMPDVNAQTLRRLRELKVEIRRELAEDWLQDAKQMAHYLRAAQSKHAKRPEADESANGLDDDRLRKWTAILASKEASLENPLEPWRALASVTAADESTLLSEWRKLVERYAKEAGAREEFNRQFVPFADFRRGDHAGWQADGQSLREESSHSGDFVVSPTGDAVLRAVLPAGCFTHVLSDKLNGALRSPVLPGGKKHISLQVMGQRSSAVRLVSNNCQLNYKNYRALSSSDLQWVTFAPPDDRDSLRVYAELMTMFDNPKFPDQLSALGGDKENYRLPWEKAAANPRSYFGVTRVVLHDNPEPPKPDLSHFRPLFTGAEPTTFADLAAKYATVVEAAIQRWASDRATDDDVLWIDALLRYGLVGNSCGPATRLVSLVEQYRKTEAELTLPRIVPGVSDCGPGVDQPVFIRGDCLRPGKTTPRRYLEVLSSPAESFTTNGSGRLELAQRLASPENPLTARVMVNRVWHHVFGAGIVRTVDDFGHVGEAPSHAELLDYLTAQFVENGWSVKRLVRSLVLSRTFQLANQPSTAARESDPRNRLLQHFPARRMEAEAIRDAILATSGRLDRTRYGMSIQPYREQANADRRLFPGPLDGDGRRSIYIKNNLMEAPKFLEAFNFPGGKVAQGRRDVTNVPAQALALLNDPFVLQQADVWAGQLVAHSDDTVAARIDAVFRRALSRPPRAEEQARFEQAVARFAELRHVPAVDVLRSQVVWRDVAHSLLNVKEFIYIP